MEGKGVQTPAMELNATDSPVDESPEVDATGREATGRKRPDFVLDRGGARNRLPDTGTEDLSLEGQPERSGPEGLARAWKEGTPKPPPPSPTARKRNPPTARKEDRGGDGAGTGARPPPPGVTQDEPKGKPQGPWNPPPRS